VGAVVAAGSYAPEQALIAHLDAALYTANREGKNRTVKSVAHAANTSVPE
jgi:PleD family two-component response regulator